MKSRNFRKSAFTLVELIIVLGIVAVLMSVTLSGFYFLRDSISVSNAAQGMKAAIRDAQDKALTYSVTENDTSTAHLNVLIYRPYWVYGYTLQYESSTNQYILYSIESGSIDVSSQTLSTQTISNNTILLKNNWASGSGHNKDCKLSNLKINGFNDGNCVVQAKYDLVSDLYPSSNLPCQILFTTVNASSYIYGGNTDCTIQFSRSLKQQTVYFVKSSSAIGEVKICDGIVSTC